MSVRSRALSVPDVQPTVPRVIAFYLLGGIIEAGMLMSIMLWSMPLGGNIDTLGIFGLMTVLSPTLPGMGFTIPAYVLAAVLLTLHSGIGVER